MCIVHADLNGDGWWRKVPNSTHISTENLYKHIHSHIHIFMAIHKHITVKTYFHIINCADKYLYEFSCVSWYVWCERVIVCECYSVCYLQIKKAKLIIVCVARKTPEKYIEQKVDTYTRCTNFSLVVVERARRTQRMRRERVKANVKPLNGKTMCTT